VIRREKKKRSELKMKMKESDARENDSLDSAITPATITRR
jgi:hypothetical protein